MASYVASPHDNQFHFHSDHSLLTATPFSAQPTASQIHILISIRILHGLTPFLPSSHSYRSGPGTHICFSLPQAWTAEAGIFKTVYVPSNIPYLQFPEAPMFNPSSLILQAVVP